jgi:NTP pyrophosphatase (non-canonical NTP hydrolase)
MNEALMKECVRVSSNAANHAGHMFTDKRHLFFLILALAGEVGELANIVKKIWRDGNPLADEKMFDEIADIYIYLSLIAHWCGIDLDSRAASKMLEVRKRPFAQPKNVRTAVEKEHPERDAIALQNAEFDAMRDLIKAYQRCVNTPVVNDDYPEMRHYYDSALMTFTKALKENRGERFFDY